jgi:hypothetical protein
MGDPNLIKMEKAVTFLLEVRQTAFQKERVVPELSWTGHSPNRIGKGERNTWITQRGY